MNWQLALKTHAVTNGNMLSIAEAIEPQVFNEIKKALRVFRAQWIGGKTQAFTLALDAQECLNYLLSVTSLPKPNPHSYHPTPADVKHWIFEETAANPCYWSHITERCVEILEPSAGNGSLCDSIAESFNKVDIPYNLTTVELDEINCITLRGKGYSPIKTDFLKFKSEKTYDLIVLNPPFESLNWLKHVRHAQSMLKPEGKLVAVIPTQQLKTSDKPQVIEFRDEVSLTLDDPFIFEAGTFKSAKQTETRIIELHSHDAMKMIVSPALKAYIAKNFEITYENEFEIRESLAGVKYNSDNSVTLDRVMSILRPVEAICHDINVYLPQSWYVEFCQAAADDLGLTPVESVEVPQVENIKPTEVDIPTEEIDEFSLTASPAITPVAAEKKQQAPKRKVPREEISSKKDYEQMDLFAA